MKNILRTIFLFFPGLLLFFIPGKASGQKLAFIFIHGVGATPIDQSSQNYYTGGFGGEAGFGLGGNKTFFTGSIGYTSFNGKGLVKNETYIPVKIGVRQYLPLKLVFIDANAGIGMVSNSQPTIATPNPSGARFAADLGAGIKLGNLELAANFDTFKEPNPDGWSGWIVFKAGFRIGI